MTPLDLRRQRFAALSPGSPSALYTARTIPDKLFRRLREVVTAYVGRSLPEPVGKAFLIRALNLGRSGIKTITPGGIVVPKRNSVLEYNLVLRTFAEIIEALGIGHLIDSWHVPPNVRVKYHDITTTGRVRPSERPHSDAWAGEHPESVTVHIPIFGDTEGNYVAVYAPPESFEEKWLEPCASDDAQHIIAYETTMCNRWGFKEPFVTPKGSVLFADASVLHASFREPRCGTRISIEAPFVWKGARQMPLLRLEEHAPHATLLGAGASHLFYFPDEPGQQVESRGAIKHPSNLEIKTLT